MKNKSWRFLCLLLGLCVCMSGCNFGSSAQGDAPSAQEKQEDGHTTEIIVPGGKEDKGKTEEEARQFTKSLAELQEKCYEVFGFFDEEEEQE